MVLEIFKSNRPPQQEQLTAGPWFWFWFWFGSGSGPVHSRALGRCWMLREPGGATRPCVLSEGRSRVVIGLVEVARAGGRPERDDGRRRSGGDGHKRPRATNYKYGSPVVPEMCDFDFSSKWLSDITCCLCDVYTF